MKRNNKFQEMRSSIKGNLNLKISQEKLMSQRKEIIEKDGVFNIYYIMGNFHNFYQEFEILGEGCVGLVKKVRKISTGEYFACKTVKLKDEETVVQVIREFKSIKELNHPNIVKMHELYVDEIKRRIFTIMELVEAREMFEVIRKLGSYSEQIASKIFKQILSSIRYMHEQLVCHRDLKPNNILATEDGLCVKITDFNISKFGIESKKDKFYNKNIKMWTYTGTVSFSAPDVFSECEYDQSVDIWSAGVVLYTMLSGQEPFQAEYLKDLIHKIQTANYSFPSESWDHVSEEAKDLIRKCLILNPQERITPEQALIHPWITGKQNTSPLTLIFFNNFENNAHRFSKQVNAYEKLGLIKIQERKKSVDSSILRQHQLRQFYMKNSNSSSTISNLTKEFLEEQGNLKNQNQQQMLGNEQSNSLNSMTISNQNSCTSSPYSNNHNLKLESMSQMSGCSPTIKNFCKLAESIEESEGDSGFNSPLNQRSPRSKKYHKTLIIHDRYRLSEQDQFIIQQNEKIATSTSSIHNLTDQILDSSTLQILNFSSANSNHNVQNTSSQNDNNSNNYINNSNSNNSFNNSNNSIMSLNKMYSKNRLNENNNQIVEENSQTSINSVDVFQSTSDLINIQTIRSKFFIPPSMIKTQEDAKVNQKEDSQQETSISPLKSYKQSKVQLTISKVNC